VPFASDPTLISQGARLRSCFGGSGTRGFRRLACGSEAGPASDPRGSVPAGTHVSGWVFGGEDMVQVSAHGGPPAQSVPRSSLRVLQDHGGSMVGLARPHEELWSP